MATISSYKTRNGETRYRVRYRTPKRKQTDKRGFRTKRDAERFAATVEVAKMRGEYIPPTLGRITVEQLGPAWLERQKGHMKPSGGRTRAPGGSTFSHGGATLGCPISALPQCRLGCRSLLQRAVQLLCRRPTRCSHGHWMMRCGTGCWHRTPCEM